jgi:hypothetical protein
VTDEELGRAWRLFQIRHALLTCPYLGFSFNVPNFDIRIPEIHLATASILYANLVSIVDEAIGLRMPAADYERCVNLGNRLAWLNARGELTDFNALDLIRERRNQVAHEIDRPATVAELRDACLVVRTQLMAWGLAADEPAYEVTFERTAMRATTAPGYDYELDRIVRVASGGRILYEATSVARFGPAGQA